MSDEHFDRRVFLVNALVGREHRERYLNHAGFHHFIDLLAESLPVWVAGMAKRSVDDDQRIAEAVARLERGPMGDATITWAERDG